jgi:outer membrane protein, multidrug efflux system
VEDALVAHRKAREALGEQEAAVRASQEALAVAELRYGAGRTGYLDVLDAQRTLLAAELAQSRTLLSQLVAVVQLYRALGGGWAPESTEPAAQSRSSVPAISRVSSEEAVTRGLPAAR